MIRIHLSDEELLELNEVLRTSQDRRMRARLQSVIMAHQGVRHQEIADTLGITSRTIQRWLNAYQRDGLAGLPPRKARGARPRLVSELAPVIRQWVQDGPQASGVNRPHWTYAELADHLSRTHGVQIRKSALQVFCHRHGIRIERRLAHSPSFHGSEGTSEDQGDGGFSPGHGVSCPCKIPSITSAVRFSTDHNSGAALTGPCHNNQ